MMLSRFTSPLAILFYAAIVLLAKEATLAGAWTYWDSDNAPPTTIEISMVQLQGDGQPLNGQCNRMSGWPQNIFRNFNDVYIAQTLPGEWPAGSPQQGYQAGAAAVRDYGWYWALYWSPTKHCASDFHADVDNSTWFQYFQDFASARRWDTDDATWETSGERLYKTGTYWGPNSIFLSEYIAGSGSDGCGAVSGANPAYKMGQFGSNACANAGYAWTTTTTSKYYYGVPSSWDGWTRNSRAANWSFESGNADDWNVTSGTWGVCTSSCAVYGRAAFRLYHSSGPSQGLFQDMDPTHNVSGRSYYQGVSLRCLSYPVCSGSLCIQYDVFLPDEQNFCTGYSIPDDQTWHFVGLSSTPTYSLHPVQMNVRWLLWFDTSGSTLSIDGASFYCTSSCP